MKFNIEVELDYIGEDGCLDDAIKESILSSVTKTVMEKVSEQVDAKLDAIIVKAAEDKASKIVDMITGEFMNKEFSRIDQFGDEIETGLTVKNLLKKRFDEFWKAPVNSDGGEGRHGETKSRVEWKIEAMIKIHSEKFAKILTADTEDKIKASMKENLSKTIGAKLVTELGFDKLLLESKK